jgi:hypothetical protein
VDNHEERDRLDSVRVGLRVAALALAGLPALMTTPLPRGFLATPVDHTRVAAAAVAEAQLPDAAHWGEFVTTSGLGLLLVGLVFTLPRRYGRGLAPWVAAVLALLGLFLGYAAVSTGAAPYGLNQLMVPAIGNLLAALALFLGVRLGAAGAGSATQTGSTRDLAGT